MRNNKSGQEPDEAPRTRRCGHCGELLLTQRRHAKYCDRRCKELARGARKRAGDRLTSLRGKHPFADRADLREFSDEIDLIGLDDQDDETGIIAGDTAPDPFEERNQAWAERQEFANAIDAVQEEFDRKAGKFIEQQKRNPGRLLPELAELRRERDARTAELQRDHWRAEAHAMAAREQPYRRASAHERSVEKAAARSLQVDLGRGRHLRDDPADAGRDVRDAWVW